MANKLLVKFIKQTRKKGYSDLQIRDIILKKNYPEKEIYKAFEFLEKTPKIKNQIQIYLNDELIKALEKRAKKNQFTLNEQIEDILRRSCIRKTKLTPKDTVDDALLACFSRRKPGRRI